MAEAAQSLQVPQHIGYIVDGNRRWAKQHGIPTYEGHLAGYSALLDVAFATIDQGVKYATAYVFSTENWKRSEEEVSKLMGLVLRIVQSDLHLFIKRGIRLVILGNRETLPAKILAAIEKAESETAQLTNGTIGLCFNYGGQLEIVDAVKKIIAEGTAVDDISTELIEQNLYAPEMPPCDIIVRTSGEQRLSNFMLWRAAYSEFLFLDKMWPEMNEKDVTGIIEEFSRRNRRFGS